MTENHNKDTAEKAKSIPACYAAVEPTAVYVPLDQFLVSKEQFELITTEIFGPFQIVTCWDDAKDGDFETVIRVLEKMENHLTGRRTSTCCDFEAD
mgnify:CR=1 FL=1